MFENLTTAAGSDSHFLQLHLIVLFQDCGLRYSEKFKRGLRSCYLLGYLGHRSSCSALFLFLYQQRLHRVKVELFNGYTMEVNTKQWNEKDLQALEDKHFSVQGVRCNLLVGDCHAAVSTHLRNVCCPEKLGCLLSLHTAFEYHDSIFVSLIGTHFGLLLNVVFHWETFLTSLHLFFFFY